MKKKFIYFIYLIAISSSTTAQTINLEFPYFAGQTYEFTIFQGEKRIKLREDAIPKGGKVQLAIPENYKGYKGMAQWYFTNSATGGGLDLIINNENFSVSCLDSIPTTENIVYKNTIENLSDKATYKKQQELFEKHDAMLATKRAYDPKSKFYKLAIKEYTSIIKQYDAYSYDLNQSPLFAAKFRQIVNLTMGIGTIITLDQKEKANNINNFITNDLDFSILYTSNHWGGIINSWTQIHTEVFKDDAKLVADATTILNRIQSDAIYTDFVLNLTKELTKAGKDDVLSALIPGIQNSKRLLHYDGVLNVFKQDLSGKAPDLVIKNTNGSTILKTTELNSKYSLLLFYQSGCGHCETTIEELKKNYKDLVTKNIKIISIAGDTDQDTFEKSATTFPWSDKYRDIEGMKGINFKNYGVIGTPTMYIIDEKGSIVQKTASFLEVLNWITKH
jgi:peroxiredoxin